MSESTKWYALSATIGVLGPVAILLLNAWGVWIALIVGGSAILGFFGPRPIYRWPLVIVGIQPIAVYVSVLLEGGISDPGSSTGGAVAVAIFSFFALATLPFGLAAAFGGAWLARRMGRTDDADGLNSE